MKFINEKSKGKNGAKKGVTPEATLRKQGAYDLMKQRHKFRLRMPG